MKMPRNFFAGYFTEFEAFLLSQKHHCFHLLRGDVLFQNGRSDYACYYVQSGTVAVSGVTDGGSKKIICMYSDGCCSSMFLSQEVDSIYLQVTSQALSEAVVLAFSRQTVTDMLKQNSAFMLRMFDFTSDLLVMLTYQNLALPYLSSERKVCDLLYMLYVHIPSPADRRERTIPFLQEQIANMVGITRTQVTRLLRDLKDWGIVETRRGSIRIVDPNKLLERCSNAVNCI